MHRILRWLRPTYFAVQALSERLERFMAEIRQDVKDIIDKFNVETTKISDKLDKLIANAAGLTADEKAAFQVVADRLDAIGADPVNPIPPTP